MQEASFGKKDLLTERVYGMVWYIRSERRNTWLNSSSGANDVGVERWNGGTRTIKSHHLRGFSAAITRPFDTRRPRMLEATTDAARTRFPGDPSSPTASGVTRGT